MKTIILSITITLIVNINYAKAQSAEYLREVHNIEYIYGYESPRGKKFDKHIRDSLMAVNNQRIAAKISQEKRAVFINDSSAKAYQKHYVSDETKQNALIDRMRWATDSIAKAEHWGRDTMYYTDTTKVMVFYYMEGYGAAHHTNSDFFWRKCYALSFMKRVSGIEDKFYRLVSQEFNPIDEYSVGKVVIQDWK